MQDEALVAEVLHLAHALGYGRRIHFKKMEVYKILGAYFGCSASTARRYWSKAVGEAMRSYGSLGTESGRSPGVGRIHAEDVAMLIEVLQHTGSSSAC